MPSAELSPVSSGTDGFLKGKQAGGAALTLLGPWARERLQQS